MQVKLCHLDATKSPEKEIQGNGQIGKKLVLLA